jgi:hypothetical protein
LKRTSLNHLPKCVLELVCSKLDQIVNGISNTLRL